ncbi:hypothetical protein N2152v2_009926 [Parachlorella kessleri]
MAVGCDLLAVLEPVNQLAATMECKDALALGLSVLRRREEQHQQQRQRSLCCAPVQAQQAEQPNSSGSTDGQSTITSDSTSRNGSSGGQQPSEPCPLHSCLLRYGITDLAAISAPRHLALSQEAVDSNVEPKLAALAAEGLNLKQVTQILLAEGSPLWCSYGATFLPNLQLLRQCKLEARLPLLLRFLDSYMGEEGAGRRLVRARPLLAGATVTIAQRTIGSLAARGFDKEEMRAMISKDATLLIANLASPQQRQKLDWISQPPPTPGVLAIYGDAQFMAAVRKQVQKQGRELPWASWAEWEEAWLGTEEGSKWGFPPLKD